MLDKRERRQTSDSLRNSVLSVASRGGTRPRRELGRKGQDSLLSPLMSMLKRFWVNWKQKQPPTRRFYKKLKGRCNTNERETKSAIDSGKHLDIDRTSEIEDRIAPSAKLSTEAKNLQCDIVSKHQPLDEATTVRKKQLVSFTQEEKKLLEARLSLLRSSRGCSPLSAMVGSRSLWNPSNSEDQRPQVRDHGVQEAPH